ncbi:MAG: prephenate dehydrogenase/arogenate dehydrogenase family protein [Pseudomonadota bacterium]
MIGRLTIIGVGLIGGSLARALKQAGAVREIVGCGRDEAELRKAVALGVIDRYELAPARAAAGADVVVLAVPLGAMEPVMQALSGALAPHTVLTDVGSAKGSVVDAARKVFGVLPAGFVPGHPIAGTEKSGVEASFAELFRRRKVIITPLETSSEPAISTVAAMWSHTGAQVVEMSVQHHDHVLAATSHLPHVLAYALVDSLARLDETSEIFQFAAGGFRDFTRIASSDAQMWHDICLANRDEVLAMLELYQRELGSFTELLRAGDSSAILEIFSRAKLARDHFTRLISE